MLNLGFGRPDQCMDQTDKKTLMGVLCLVCLNNPLANHVARVSDSEPKSRLRVRASIRVYESLIPGLSGTMIIVGGISGPSFCVPLWKTKDPVVGTVGAPSSFSPSRFPLATQPIWRRSRSFTVTNLQYDTLYVESLSHHPCDPGGSFENRE